MSTTIKTSSEKQMDQIRRFAKKNNIYNTITKENDFYIIILFGLTIAESEKLIKNYLKANRFTKAPHESHATAA